VRPSPEDVIRAIYDAAQKGLRVVAVSGPPLGALELGPDSLAALEEVQVNVTGEGGISTEATLAGLLAMVTPGAPEQHVGTADLTTQTVTFSGPAKHVTVVNPTKNAVLEVSFDGGTSFVQLHGPDALSVACRASEVRVRSTLDPIPYGVIAAV
jgi:hypothetical protein